MVSQNRDSTMQGITRGRSPLSRISDLGFYMDYCKSRHRYAPGVHHHQSYELYYSLGDPIRFFVESKEVQICPGDIMLIRPYAPHYPEYVTHALRQRILCHFSDEYINGLFRYEGSDNLLDCLYGEGSPTVTHTRLRLTERERVQECLFSALNEFNCKSSISEALIDAYMTEITAILMRNAALESRNRSAEHAEKSRPTIKERIRDIARYIDDNYSTDITLESICSKFFLNKYYLCHAFKELTGHSIVQYTNTRRIAEAERRLLTTDGSVSDIASAVGFNSLTHFIRTFKKLTGMPPGEFRHAVRQGTLFREDSAYSE